MTAAARLSWRRALILLAGALLLAGCGYADPMASTGPAASTTKCVEDFNEGSGQTPVKFPDGLQVIDLKVGGGATAEPGDSLKMNYTGWLSDGTKFDSTCDRGQPFDVTIGKGQVIPGWDEGVPGMKVGGRRKLVIPPALGYGSQGAGQTIPPNSTLVFSIELLAVSSHGTASPSPSTSAASPSPGR